ncbi:hypothetical protein B0T11DRAFT_19071 [Plectosphaerella cucumerina]|uniref:Zn(2)-C6 fungal-type domain-containing protein n=1 Tax=Plectosphaerella cucumerina TaxID=40658 RepID=A0A8K0X9E2_9PEZI|nr:hypothetical protein B0T11DRAFT_19071 [Plectosphaerella cucumerina]
MPRARKPGALAPKSRSRNGCWPCKGRKVKCGEERPSCLNCLKLGDTCDYNIRLNWGGRRTKKSSQSLESPLAPTPPQQQQQQYVNPEPSLILKRSHTFPTTASSSSTTVCGPTQQQSSQVHPAWQSLGQGPPESLEYTDGTSHVPRASSSSSLFGKGAPSFPVPVAVMPSWSPFGRQADTFSSPLADDAGAYVPQAKHRRAKSLAEVSDAMSAWHHSPIMSSTSSHDMGSPCPPLSIAQHGYSSVSHGSPATPAVSAVIGDEEESKAGLLLPPPMPPFQGSDSDAAEAYSFYGFDVGAQDRDVGRNDDAACVPYIGFPASKINGGVHLISQSLADRAAAHRGLGGYYDSPVPILIPRHLEPIPEKYVTF